MVGTQLLGVRMATLVRFVPLLLLLYAVGTVGGLTQRAIRRSCGGRESASLYHRAKYLQIVVLGLGAVGVLVWPGPLQWEAVRCVDCRGGGQLGAAPVGVLQEAPVGRASSLRPPSTARRCRARC